MKKITLQIGDSFNRKTLVRISKSKARKIFNSGEHAPFIYLSTVKAHEDYPNLFSIYKDRPSWDGMSFDDMVDWYTQHTCNYANGYYPIYYIQRCELAN